MPKVRFDLISRQSVPSNPRNPGHQGKSILGKPPLVRGTRSPIQQVGQSRSNQIPESWRSAPMAGPCRREVVRRQIDVMGGIASRLEPRGYGRITTSEVVHVFENGLAYDYVDRGSPDHALVYPRHLIA